MAKRIPLFNNETGKWEWHWIKSDFEEEEGGETMTKQGRIPLERLRELSAQGKDAKEIAKLLGVTYDGVRRAEIRLGLRPLTPKTKEQRERYGRGGRIDREELRRLVSEGKSPKEIAALMGVNVRNVTKTLHVLGMEWKRYRRTSPGQGNEPGEGSPQSPGRNPAHRFDADSPRMVELLKEGKTSIQICGEMGISSRTLYLWKKKLGLLGLAIPSSGSGPAQKNAGAQGTGEPEASPGKERHTSVLERDLPFGYYLEIAERFVNFLEINHRASFLKFQELETEKGTSRDDLDRALEIAFRMNKLGVLH